MSKKNGNGNNNLARLEQSERAGKVNLAEWRASRVHELDLPSGLTIKLRDVTLTDLMITGRLPESIMTIFASQIKDDTKEVDLEVITKNTAEFNQMLVVMIQVSLLEPQIGTVADDEHILLEEIPFDDKMAIFNFLNRGAEQVRPFREGEAQPGTPA